MRRSSHDDSGTDAAVKDCRLWKASSNVIGRRLALSMRVSCGHGALRVHPRRRSLGAVQDVKPNMMRSALQHSMS